MIIPHDYGLLILTCAEFNGVPDEKGAEYLKKAKEEFHKGNDITIKGRPNPSPREGMDTELKRKWKGKEDE